MADLPTPVSRQDELLHNIADGTPDISDLEPISREEEYLKYIALNGTGGGGGGDLPLPVSISNGGTGATNVSSARTNLDIYSKSEVDNKIQSSSGNINVVQTTGTSTTDVMSQNAVSTINVLGQSASRSDTVSIVFGNEATATGSSNVCLGSKASTDGTGSISIGYRASSDTNSVSIGRMASTTGGSGDSCVAIGELSQAYGHRSISIGPSATSNSENCITLGAGAYIYNDAAENVALGANSGIDQGISYSIALGNSSNVSESYSLSIGNNVFTRKIERVTDPTNAQDAATTNYVDSKIPDLPVSIANGGTGATTSDSARTNLDVYSKEEVDNKIQSSSSSINVVQTTGTSTTDVMSQNAVTHMYDNISIGVNSTLTNNTPGEISKSIAIGGQSEALSNNNGPSIAIGYNVKTLSPNSVAIGHDADVVEGAGNSVAIGSFSRATEDSVVSFGSGTGDDNTTYRRLVNVDDPTSEYEAANKKYVDGLFNQLNTKTIPISQGGTGATDLVNARTNLELLKEYVLYYNASGTNSTITLSDAYTNYEKIGVYAISFTGGYPAYNEMLPAVSNVLPIFELNYEGDEVENTIFRGTFLSFSENNVYFSSTAASSVWSTGYSKNTDDGMKVVKIIGYKY